MSDVGKLACFAFLLMALTSPAQAVCLEKNPHAPGGIASVEPRHMSVRAEYLRSKYVVVASVKPATSVRETDNTGGTNYSIVPAKIFKGHPPGTLTIYSENSSGRFPMELGRQYVLFIYQAGSHYSVDNCGYSGPLSESVGIIARIKVQTRMER